MTDWNGKVDRNLDPANIALQRLQTETQASANGRLVELDIKDLLEHDPPPIDWLWNGYIVRGTLTLLHGDGGLGKSLLALALVRAAVDGRRFLGRDTWPIRAAILDGENPVPELHRRLHRLGFKAVADKVRYW